MRISVVIPACNGERYLESTLSSVLAQTRPADEVLVLDDDSSDGTAQIARASKWCGRVAYRHHAPATGFVDAWNRAAAAATGDFVSILHQDDLLHGEFLARMEQTSAAHPRVRHLFAASNYIDADGHEVGTPPKPHDLTPVRYRGRDYAGRYLQGVAANRHLHRCPGILVERALLLHECTFRREAGHIADDDFFLRVGGHTDVVGISAPLASFRMHPGSVTGRLDLLSRSLARDYLFQLGYHHSPATILGAAEIGLIDGLAVKFVNLLLFQSLQLGQQELTLEALDLRQKMETVVPLLFRRHLPFWGGAMWAAAARPSTTPLARGYVRALSALIAALAALS